MNAYKSRYAENWHEKSLKAKQKTNFHCCLCLKKFKYLESHHVVYCNKKRHKIAGDERVGVHIFPLCKHCHSKETGCAHHPDNWIIDPTNPNRNRNTVEFYRKLVHNYQTIQNYLKCKNQTKSLTLKNTKPKSKAKPKLTTKLLSSL